jgi:hypothetical protein
MISVAKHFNHNSIYVYFLDEQGYTYIRAVSSNGKIIWWKHKDNPAEDWFYVDEKETEHRYQIGLREKKLNIILK